MPSQIYQPPLIPGSVKQRSLAASSAIAKGDLYYGDGGNNFVKFAIGTTGQQLMVIGGIPTWATFPQTGTAANRPSAGRFTGDQYFATDTLAFSAWTGSAWKSTTLA